MAGNEIIKIEITNWDDWQPQGQKRLKRPAWFALSNGIGQDPEIDALNFEEKWTFICVLSERSRQAKPVITLSKNHFERSYGLKWKNVLSIVDKLPNLQDMRTRCADGAHEMRESCAREEEEKRREEERDADSSLQDNILELYTKLLSSKGLPDVRELTPRRKLKLRSRLKERPALKDWEELFKRAAATPFLLGENERGWRADFDWFITNPDNAVKLLEGKYDNHKKQKPKFKEFFSTGGEAHAPS